MRKLSIAGVMICGLILAAIAPHTADAEIDKREQRQNWSNVLRLIKDVDAVDETAEAVKSMNGMLDHSMALELLKYFDDCDMAWDASQGDKNAPRGAKGRPKDAYKISNAMLACIVAMPDATEVAKFEKQVSDTKAFSMRPRMAMVDAMEKHSSNEDCRRVIVDMVRNEKKDVDTDMRILAVLATGKFEMDQELFNLILSNLRDDSWRIRDAAVQAVLDSFRFNEDQAVLAMINALATESGKMRKVMSDALKRITRQDLGTDPDAWIDWFKNKQREDQGLPPKTGKTNRGTRVFETESFSDRYVFLIDTSVSMTQRISDEEKERLKRSITSEPDAEKDPRRPLDWDLINNKLDLAREEMIRSLEVMDPETTTFTIISFSEDVTPWKEELVPTDEKNIDAAAKWLRAMKGKNRTNVFGVLDAAYDLSEALAGVDVDKRKNRRGKRSGPITGKHPDEALPDTIYLYTDGYATWGKYAGDDAAWEGKSPAEKAQLYAPIMREMVNEIKDRNRIARITLNCIGVGNPQDNTTLRNLARSCGGEYIAIGR